MSVLREPALPPRLPAQATDAACNKAAHDHKAPANRGRWCDDPNRGTRLAIHAAQPGRTTWPPPFDYAHRAPSPTQAFGGPRLPRATAPLPAKARSNQALRIKLSESSSANQALRIKLCRCHPTRNCHLVHSANHAEPSESRLRAWGNPPRVKAPRRWYYIHPPEQACAVVRKFKFP